jgi:hypothetical protein
MDKGQGGSPEVTDYEQFLIDTWAFVRKVVPDASEEMQGRAVRRIATNLMFLFDENGMKRAK